MSKMKFPGLSNITVQEAAVWGRVCREEGKTPAQALEIISCVDDLLTIQRMAPMINKRRGNIVRRVKMKDILIERIMQAET